MVIFFVVLTMADDDQSLVEAIYNKFQSHQGEHVQIFVPKTMPGINGMIYICIT